jgi:vitamin B12 transport system substrate-binding protein
VKPFFKPEYWLLLLLAAFLTHAAAAKQASEMAQIALEKPQRIISLAPHITELIYAIGAGDSLIAVSDYSDYPSAALALPRVASYASINIEAIIALQPDLIIAWQNGNSPADVKRLQQFGFNVQLSNPIYIEDIATELTNLGQLTGQQQQAKQQAELFSQQLTALRQQYQHKKPLKVFFAMNTKPLSTVANLAWPQQMLTICAADNIFANSKGDYPQLGIEQVVAGKPEVIIHAATDNQAVDQHYWQRYRDIPAVAQQQFLTVNADFLFRTTPRTLLGIKQLCHGLDAFR